MTLNNYLLLFRFLLVSLRTFLIVLCVIHFRFFAIVVTFQYGYTIDYKMFKRYEIKQLSKNDTRVIKLLTLQ